MTVYARALESLVLPMFDRLKRREYMKRRRLLEESQWWTADRVREFQWSELKRLLGHVFVSVPYLQEKYRAVGIAAASDIRSWADFRLLPPLTRDEVNAHREELCSITYKGKLLPHATGGSSGVPTRFFRTYESYDWRTAAKDRVYCWSGWHVGERSVYLWGAPVGAVPRSQLWKVRLHETIQRQLVINTFTQSDDQWRRIHGAILKFKPALVVGYVSSLEEFSSFLQRNQLRVDSVRCVIGAAEPVFEATRATIEAGFRAPMFNTYGSREFMSVAGECEQRNGLHVNAENLVVETHDESIDAPSEILITDLHNYGMAFVRYGTGDLGTMMPGSCACGRGLPRIRSIEGRLLDALRTADGRKVPGEFFPHLLKDVPEFAQYRVEQLAVDYIEISAVLNATLSERSHQLLRSEIAKVFGPGTHWHIREVSNIPQLKSGKRRVTVGLEA